MIEELTARVFEARDIAHRAHWRTKSYAQHMALGAFYEDVIEHVDALVEAYQGKNGLIGDFNCTTRSVTPNKMVDYLAEEAAWISTHRSEIADECPTIANLVDNLIAVYHQTVYKLEHLA